MSLSVDLLQELPATEASLAQAQCCWNTTQTTCATTPTPTPITSMAITTCHTCTNTG